MGISIFIFLQIIAGNLKICICVKGTNIHIAPQHGQHISIDLNKIVQNFMKETKMPEVYKHRYRTNYILFQFVLRADKCNYLVPFNSTEKIGFHPL